MAILRESEIETQPCRYGVLSFFKNDTIISRSLREYGEWAQAEIEFLLDFIDSGDIVLDVGAFIGTHTIAFAERVSARGHVYAFEPQPVFFEILKKNIGQNVLSNVSLFDVALSDEVGQKAVHEIDVQNPQNFAGTSLQESISVPADTARYHKIDFTTVDQLGIESCNVIKIDAEEMELNVLRGAQRTIGTNRPMVFAECNSLQHGWPVVEFMKQQEYCVYLLNVPAFNPKNFRHSSNNFLGDGREAGLVLIPKERHSVLQDRLNQLQRRPYVIPISGLDDLALGLLKKPQYKYEVMSTRKAANVLGIGFWANETEVERFRREIAALHAEIEKMRNQIISLNPAQFQVTIQAQQQALAEKEKEISGLSELVKQKEAQFQATIQAQQQTLAEKEKEISGLGELSKQKAAQFQATIQAQQKTLAEKEKEISGLGELSKQKAAQFQATIRAQQQILAAKEMEISSLVTEHRKVVEESAAKEMEISSLVTEHRKVVEESAAKDAILNGIYDSHGWKALLVYYGTRNKLLPEGTWQRNFAKRFFHWVLRLEKAFSKQTGLLPTLPPFDSAHKSKEQQTAFQPEQTTAGSDNVASQDARLDVPTVSTTISVSDDERGFQPEQTTAGSDNVASQDARLDVPTVSTTISVSDDERGFQPEQTTAGSDNVASQDARLDVPTVSTTSSVSDDEKGKDYEILSRRISALRKSHIESLHAKPPTLISVRETELLASAKSLIFAAEDRVEVSIVIPVFNNLKFSLECLTSVMKYSSGVSYEIIVVDDGSTDRTPEVLSCVPNITYIKNEKNLGFVRTCNRGAESARGEYILFLNNDTQATENWLKALVETFKEHGDVGAVGAKILFPDGRLQEAGALVNRDGTSRLIGFFDDPDLPRYNYPREVMYCSGACLLVAAKKFREVGGFDVNLAPAYCEDWDFAFRLRQHGLRVLYNPNSVVIHHLSVTSNDVDESFKISCVVRNQQKLSEKWQHEIDNLNRVKMIAFYLPQFHPIPENDSWWGKGFTEWANVSKAQPNFVGHYQPHLPADLGFYDLRIEEVMLQQAELAKRYGIYGFCYFYYWFAGKRLLDLPLERLLKTNKPNIPFCLCWANENWTRKWDGQEQEVLIAQQHSDEDDSSVIRDLMRYMRQQNYIRINGKPLLIVYRINLFPNIKRTIQIWRDLCLKEGVGEIYLGMAESFEHSLVFEHPSQYGFDASVEFPPHGMHAPISPPGAILNREFAGVIHDYREIVFTFLQKEIPGYARFRSVMPSWDNTPRRQNDPVMFENTSPEAYQALLEAILEQTHEQNFGDERIVFINAWNEWGEGNHIEPDRRYGHGFLEATRNAQDAWLRKRRTGLD